MSDRYGDITYGPEWSARWERDFGTRPDTEDAVRCLSELARGRPLLELGVGTGRIAIPLAGRGVPVHGVDNSPSMLDQLRAKPGGDAVTVLEGDIVTGELGGPYAVVAMPSYTISAITSQDEQVDCFANAARHLTEDGCFVLEAMVPRSEALLSGAQRTVRIEPGEVVLHVTTPADPMSGVASACHVYFRHGEPPQLRPLRARHAWPAELDLMARLAGLRLTHRWGGWDRRPFGTDSAKHISVYGRRVS
ncbi:MULTISPECIES: class I SAM-dependent DNA methyltransferase [Parafrankia]|uniref:class I SAM-dependent DNA methyltransferase n=1 Tax=Parafrankia TaxID=2994362 RepID=UPI0034D66741